MNKVSNFFNVGTDVDFLGYDLPSFIRDGVKFIKISWQQDKLEELFQEVKKSDILYLRGGLIDVDDYCEFAFFDEDMNEVEPMGYSNNTFHLFYDESKCDNNSLYITLSHKHDKNDGVEMAIALD